MTTVSPSRSGAAAITSERPSPRPWYRWLLTALAFPPAGYVANLVAGRVDSVPPALLGGVIAGAGIGAAQWALLRHRGVSRTWIPATGAGLGVGLALGAALVSYRTDITSLALMGAVCGLAVGIAQGAAFGSVKRLLGWTLATASLWALGWTVTTAGGISVEDQFVVFGAYGATALAFLQSFIVRTFAPTEEATA